jgi:hypothetical protein
VTVVEDPGHFLFSDQHQKIATQAAEYQNRDNQANNKG